ncbi:MAG TPA: CHAT domain-containing protein, partial [Thermoanaerobaculia bacterium]|nr:CHAT domain-containing protein [Thermoanaerobaculia bacterium]
PWANEAREHLNRLAAERESPRFETDRQRLEAAAALGDADAVRTLVDRHRERARAFAEAEYLGRWAEALTRGDAGEAARWLTISRNIGTALAAVSGESLLRDAVQVIDAADSQKRLRIAGAHITYRRGRIAFSRREQGQGEHDLRLAAAQFAEAGDPMSLAARSYAAGARLAQNDVVQSRQELAALVTEVDARPGYLSQAGQVRWELARGLMFDDDWNGAAHLLAEAEALFRRGGETENQAMVSTMLADALIAVGQPDEAWRVHIRAFEALSSAGRLDLLAASVGGAATTAIQVGKPETARALVDIGESLARAMSNDLLLADTLVRKSLLAGPADAEEAVRSAGEASSVALRIPDASIRARHLADADLAMAVAVLASDPRRARDLATRTLDLYVETGMIAQVAEPYLARARASLRLGDASAAQRDLSAGMLAVEQHPANVAGVIGTGVLDAGSALFQEAVRLDLDRGEVASAFADSERMRGVSAGPASAGELRHRLAGSGAAVVTIVVLPGEVVSLTVTERGVAAARHAIPREEVAALAARDDDASSVALYDLLIRPSAAALADAQALIVVPDRLLEQVPFAALRDGRTGRALIERMTVSIAPSAIRLQTPSRPVKPRAVAAIGLPSGPAAGLAALPAVETEVMEIARLYPAVRGARTGEITAQTVEENAAAADVLHIAGHTEGDPAGDDALAVAGGPLSWRTISAMHDMAPVVVLSACNTLRRPHDPDRRALSLAGAFIAAGAGDVVGTLAPISDRDARALFLALHEQLARGIAAPAALRQVQLTQLRRPGAAWRHLAVLTTSIHRTD